jgi:HCOMODA/2-hydroxy-3-carboxy-muconic semialdehyde decarboxylase
MDVQLDAALLDDLVSALRILARENVLDAFGHVSLRDPVEPDRFWLSVAKPPSRVTASDFRAFGVLSGEPLQESREPLFAERYIHATVYAARQDIGAVCHHHAPSVLPFCLSSTPLAAVSQTGAFLGQRVTLWDSADEFGATRLVVDTPEQAASLARALGEDSVVLMRGHGATVVGGTLRETVFKSVYACRDAEYQIAAAAFGDVRALSEGEIAKGRQPAEAAVERCWVHWCALLGQPSQDEEKGLRA